MSTEPASADLRPFYSRIAALLQPLVDPTQYAHRGPLLMSLRPQPDDYAKVFVADSVRRAASGYEQLWRQLPEIPFKITQTQLRIFTAWSQDFAALDARAVAFPGGYRSIAAQLLPDVPWAAWEVIEAGATDGILFDGLVAIGDRFAWFPKPWRVLSDE